MNKRKLRGCLTPVECGQLQRAWYAASKGYQLDGLVSVRPQANFLAGSLDYAQHVERYWRWLGQWARRHVGVFSAILVRETYDRNLQPCSNFHILVHVGTKLPDLRRAHQRRYLGDREVDVKRANHQERINRYGKWGSAIGYTTKERLPSAAFDPVPGRHTKHYRTGLEVLGKRYLLTANLRAAAPILTVIRNHLITAPMRRETRKATARTR